jgi:hypothetical protein
MEPAVSPSGWRLGPGLVYLYGYAVTDVVCDLDSREPKESLEAVVRTADVYRQPVSSARLWVRGVVPFHADANDPMTVLAAAIHRVGSKAPAPKRGALRELRQYTERILKQITPLSFDTDLTVDTWLAQSHYTQREKELIRAEYDDQYTRIWEKFRARANGFGKDEFYDEMKHLRLICARGALFKAAFGPAMKAIENTVFSRPEFAKHIRPSELPTVLRDHIRNGSKEGLVCVIQGLVEGDDAVFFHNGKYYCTDYSAFESLFTIEFMRATEIPLMKHMLKHVPDYRERLRLMRRVLWSRNFVKLRNVSFSVEGCRMSGDMHTSLGNGWANLMAIGYLLEKCRGRDITEADFESIGLRAKMVIHDSIGEASFCGQVFDEEEMCLVRDPISAINKFGWTKTPLAHCGLRLYSGLMRAKALSFAHLAPRCPVLWAFVRYVLRVTKKGSEMWAFRHLSMYEREFLLESIGSEDLVGAPGPRTRDLVHKLYNITPAEQVSLELYFDSLVALEPLTHPSLKEHLPLKGQEMCDLYTSPSAGPRAEWPVLRRPAFLRFHPKVTAESNSPYRGMV